MKTKVQYCTEDEKGQVAVQIEKLNLSFLFCCVSSHTNGKGGYYVVPTGKSGWMRFVFTDGFTNETITDIFPILN